MTLLYLIPLLTLLGALGLAVHLLGRRLLPDTPGATWIAALLLIATLFAVEHVIMLPRWALLAAAAGIVLAGAREFNEWPPRERWVLLGLVIVAFGYPLIWRLLFPSVYPSSERVTNLLFISNYLNAEQLPPLDQWLPPYRFDFYYPLQYYALALLGRAFGMSPGVTYNLGFVLLAGSSIALVFTLARRVTGQGWRAAYVTALLALGTTGISLATAWHGYAHPPEARANTAFLSLTLDARINSVNAAKLGLIDADAQAQQTPELPVETFAYQMFLGDVHPTLIGMLLGFLLMAVLWRASTVAPGDPHETRLWAAAGFITAAMLAGNTWIFPLMVIALAVWYGWSVSLERDPQRALQRAAWLAAGGIAALILLMPVVQGLSARTLNTPLRLVGADERGSWLVFALQFWPLIGLAVATLILDRGRNVMSAFALMALALLLFSNLIFVDDLSVNQYQRTNSALKWWGWIWTVMFITLAIGLLAQRERRATWLAIALTAPCLGTAYPLLDHLLSPPPEDAMRIHADRVYTRSVQNQAIISFLRHQPRGVALEHITASAYDDTGVLSLFGNKPVLLGWPDHEFTWRGNMNEIYKRREAIEAFYKGEKTRSLDWLRGHDVRYVLWDQRNCQTFKKAGQAKIDAQIGTGYAFHQLNAWGDCPVGVWTRLEQ